MITLAYDHDIWYTRFYNKAYKELFFMKDMSSAPQTEDSRSVQYVSDCYRFGWLLFLALRIHSVCNFNLVTCTNGLVSILVSFSSSSFNYSWFSFSIFLFIPNEACFCASLYLSQSVSTDEVYI